MRQVYIRLRSLTTGHQWDACETAAKTYLAAGDCVIARPPRLGTRPLPMKPRRDLTGRKPRPLPKENNDV